MQTTDIFLYSYKNKFLPKVISNLLETTIDAKVYVYDQNPIDRSDLCGGINSVVYTHVVWDHQQGISKLIEDFLVQSSSRYIAILSDDLTMSNGWDTEAIQIADTYDGVVSGNGAVTIYKKDEFSFGKDYVPSNISIKTQWIDRSFIFLDRWRITQEILPLHIKYYGFEEYLTMALRNIDKNIYSLPCHLYSDSKKRNVENLYVTYSLEHGYNTMVDLLDGTLPGPKAFLEEHSLQDVKIHKLPYQTDDVKYDAFTKFNTDTLSNQNKKYNTMVKSVG